MRRIAVTLASLLVMASFSQAAIITIPGLTVSVGVVGDEVNPVLGFVDNLDGTYSSTGDYSDADFNFDWDATIKPDPFISGIFSIQNNTAVTQTFTLSITMPVFPTILSNSLHGGSVGLTLTDSNFNGTGSVADAGVAAFQGFIDGTAVLDLFDVPFGLSVPFAGGSSTVSDFDGLPGPTLPSGPVLSDIGITIKFKLSPGDSAAITSFFIVEPVPEVGTFALLAGVGIVGLGARTALRRKKSA